MAGLTAQFRCTAPVEAVQVTAVVGIAGTMRAHLIVRCSEAASITPVSEMLGISPNGSYSQRTGSDALGEICNVVAGYFQAEVGLGEMCELSVPTIIAGRDYKFHSAGS